MTSFLQEGTNQCQSPGKNGIKSGSNLPSPGYLGCDLHRVTEKEGLSIYHIVRWRLSMSRIGCFCYCFFFGGEVSGDLAGGSGQIRALPSFQPGQLIMGVYS